MTVIGRGAQIRQYAPRTRPRHCHRVPHPADSIVGREPEIVTPERERLQVDRFGPVDCAKLAENGVVIAAIGSLDMA